MTIHRIPIPEHWNYFLVVEEDVERLSRWIEFSESNESVYSIELARLLMTAAAEADVVAKAVCKVLDPASNAESINAYKDVLLRLAPQIVNAEVVLPRYGLSFKPWSKWKEDGKPPLWWQANNKVKHHRGEHFKHANLKNVLNAVGGLLILLLIYYGQDRDYIVPAPRVYVPNMFAIVEGDALRLLHPDPPPPEA